MHSTIIALSAAVTGALAGAGYYEEPAYYTTSEKVYTSVKTCTDSAPYPTSEAVYVPPTSEAVYVPPKPTEYGSEVTYTSYDVITVTSCGDYVTNCPAATYTSTAYSVSTCTGGSPYYVPPANSTEYYVPPVDYPTETPVYPTETPVYPVETPVPTYTHTYYTTVCPGKDYCYATTVTSTWCPGNPTPVPTYPPVETPTYTPVPPPVYTSVVPSCPGGDYCPPTPPKNETTPVYTPPPSYTGAASANAVSFGVAAFAGLAALFIAA